MDLTTQQVAEQLEARNGNTEEQAAAIAALASAISEALNLGPARITEKLDLVSLRPGSSAQGFSARP
jgi:hypothetical protein